MATLGVCRVDFRNWLKVASLLGLRYYVQRGRHYAQMMGYYH